LEAKLYADELGLEVNDITVDNDADDVGEPGANVNNPIDVQPIDMHDSDDSDGSNNRDSNSDTDSNVS
jgi:hypothetical protein